MDAIGDGADPGQDYDGCFAPTTIGATLAAYGFDMVVHRWDLGPALGAAEVLTDAEMDAPETSIADSVRRCTARASARRPSPPTPPARIGCSPLMGRDPGWSRSP